MVCAMVFLPLHTLHSDSSSRFILVQLCLPRRNATGQYSGYTGLGLGGERACHAPNRVPPGVIDALAVDSTKRLSSVRVRAFITLLL